MFDNGRHNSTHTGVLKKDAPGLYRTLCQRHDQEQVKTLEQAYATAARSGALEEHPVMRRVGASFNPKPARICHILISVVKEHDITTLCAAMLACCTALPREQSPPSLLASRVHSLLARTTVEGASPEEERIVLSLLVDRARHLHMSEESAHQKGAFVTYLCEHLLPAITLPEHAPLIALLSSSLERARINLTSV